MHHYLSTTFDLIKTVTLEGDYVKVFKVVQNKHGTLFCVPFLLDGQFHVNCYSKSKDHFSINLNQLLKIKEYTRPNDNFPYPMMDACFIKDNILFVNIYRATIRQMMVIQIDSVTGKLVETPFTKDFDCVAGSQRNFPLGTYFDETRNQVYMIFRQG